MINGLVKTNKDLLSIDISENICRKKSAEAIAHYLMLSPTIERVNMNKMGIADTILEKMFEKMGLKEEVESAVENSSETDSVIVPQVNVRLKVSPILSLCLSGNKISDRGAGIIASNLPLMSLTELDLSWNQIMSQGVRAISAQLNNSKIATLDLSWNALGSVLDRNRTAALHLSKMLKANKCLTHLDLSQNHLTQQECSLIGDALVENHTLLGLHITGNPGSIDCHGYLTPCTDLWPISTGDCMAKIISYDIQTKIDLDKRNNCWICGMWDEVRLSYQTVKADVQRARKIYDDAKIYSELLLGNVSIQIYTSFDNWKEGEAMKITLPKNANPAKYKVDLKMKFGGSTVGDANNVGALPEYELFRMIPPGTHYYAISICRGKLFYDVSAPRISKAMMMATAENMTFPLDKDGAPDTSFLPDFLNVLEVSPRDEVLKGLDVKGSIRKIAVPRIKNMVSLKMVKVWTIRESVVAKELHEHDRHHLMSCHMQDWQMYRFMKKMGKDSSSTSQLEAILRKNYIVLRDVYVDYCCKFSSELFFMGTGAYSEFLNSTNILDKLNDPRENSSSDPSILALVSSEIDEKLKPIDVASSLLITPSRRATLVQAGNSSAASIAGPSIGGSMPTVAEMPVMITPSRRATLVQAVKSMPATPENITSELRNINEIRVPIQPHTPKPSVENKLRINPVSSHASKSSTLDQIDHSNKKESSVKGPINNGCTRTEADMIFITNCLSGPKHELNTKRSLCRFQFIDALFFIADVKFVKTGTCRNINDAFQKLLSEYILPNAERDDSLKFREMFLLTEVVDEVLRENLKTLAEVYKRFSGAENTPSEKKTMSIAEWNYLFDLADISGHFPVITERMKDLAYCRSKSTRANQFEEMLMIKKVRQNNFVY